MNTGDRQRVRYTFRGIIQGVGFRPTVYRCAEKLGLGGFVRNQRSEVVAEVEGAPPAVARFHALLGEMLPPAAVIEKTDRLPIPLEGETDFRIAPSEPTAFHFPPIPPDLAICPECREELYDPENRRYLYPFITCTQCGPRYSIVEDTPFDRDTTSMVDFPQCPECLGEYTDPADRRFHSQTNSCWSCGPTLELRAADGTPQEGDPILETIEALQRGAVVAIQGIGGFHLAADPRNGSTMRRLRCDKEREAKPFALMVCDREEAGRLCRLPAGAAACLATPASPILVLPAADRAPAHLEAVSHTGTFGIMLPYTPLHLLLFGYPDVKIGYRHLVMTSGNLKGEPIITDPEEAQAKLSDVADLFLFHDRRILFRSDDSVQRMARQERPIFLRRSRGYVPRLISLGTDLRRNVLAVGADLKNAPALGRGSDVYLAPYIGDLDDPVTRRDFQQQVDKILSLYAVRPELIAYDLHPLYHSTRWALDFDAPLKAGVQHHHAHLLSVMAEHRLEEALGLAFDGTGYGTDGTIWGGEFLLARRGGFQRLGCFKPFPLPGGEAAVRHPPRIALSLLRGVLGRGELEALFTGTGLLSGEELTTLLDMLEKKINCPLTSSLGRIFDAAAALLGLVDRLRYEGEGPIRLEGAALHGGTNAPAAGRRPAAIALEERADGFFQLDCAPLMRDLAASRRQDPAMEPGRRASLAYAFHRAVAEAAAEGAARMQRLTGIGKLALSGGVFQNALLTDLLLPALEDRGLEVYTHRDIPPGDGGIAVGQVYFIPDSD